MEVAFDAVVWYWRGPSPFHFVTVPPDGAELIGALAPTLSYGWGCVPVRGRVGATAFVTSLFPRDGGYVVPLKAAVRAAEGLEVGDVASVVLDLG
ncbi:MAG TPA: DUF1905 domain-containing protein [Acidimicrobiales bacterium]|nr:MAG: hypothetical protein B7Z69_02895 [Actinobacteria bacterium 21-73-9]HQU25495.1 DUF1905 domain-containing protein [Acidimicrobiales bacterium]